MLTSSIMSIRRTTLAAEDADLALLESEAKRRGTSLAQVLREVVGREAAELRRSRRPSFGLGHGGPDLARSSVEHEDEPFQAQ